MAIFDDKYYIDLILKGNTNLYRFLVDRYKKMVFSICLRILVNAEDAEDAAQESFLKAYQKLNTYQGKSKFSTWLYTIAYRISVSKLKENNLETLAINNEIIENFSTSYEKQPFDTLKDIEVSQFVNKAIQKLPQIEALLITLYYLEESSIKDIVEITGLSESNVKVKLFRARKVLEQSLRFLL
jgi:RNA polymerase sigma factor (sigma-70 family)